MLIVENVSKIINQTLVLPKIGFGLASGGLMQIKGSNGTGKSTLLRILTGLTLSDSGTITWNGLNIRSNLNFYQKNIISYLGHDLGIKSNLTLIQNLAFWAEIYNNHELLLPAMAYFQLSPYADYLVSELSAGWKKKLALARLILHDNPLWILDEPDVNLDSDARKAFLNLLTTKLSSGGVAIVVSHNITNIPSTCVLDIEDFIIKEEAYE